MLRILFIPWAFVSRCFLPQATRNTLSTAEVHALSSATDKSSMFSQQNTALNKIQSTYMSSRPRSRQSQFVGTTFSQTREMIQLGLTLPVSQPILEMRCLHLPPRILLISM